MTEQKRRGRPPKAEFATFTSAVIGDGARRIDGPVQVFRDPFDVQTAQAYADRVWAGQSESADRPWRLQRVKEALEGQGMSMEGVVL
jgi:hypothetical protein